MEIHLYTVSTQSLVKIKVENQTHDIVGLLLTKDFTDE